MFLNVTILRLSATVHTYKLQLVYPSLPDLHIHSSRFVASFPVVLWGIAFQVGQFSTLSARRAKQSPGSASQSLLPFPLLNINTSSLYQYTKLPNI